LKTVQEDAHDHLHAAVAHAGESSHL
jgi:hypothetical protein